MAGIALLALIIGGIGFSIVLRNRPKDKEPGSVSTFFESFFFLIMGLGIIVGLIMVFIHSCNNYSSDWDLNLFK